MPLVIVALAGRVAAKALRQVTNRERDKLYRRAVAATRRGSAD